MLFFFNEILLSKSSLTWCKLWYNTSRTSCCFLFRSLESSKRLLCFYSIQGVNDYKWESQILRKHLCKFLLCWKNIKWIKNQCIGEKSKDREELILIQDTGNAYQKLALSQKNQRSWNVCDSIYPLDSHSRDDVNLWSFGQAVLHTFYSLENYIRSIYYNNFP